jgi:hypothetical protein
MMPPDRSLDERMTALAGANEIRSYRAALKRDLRAGNANVIDVLLAPTPQLNTMKVEDLLGAVPGLGPVKIAMMLRASRASRAKTVGGLSVRQRRELAALLRDSQDCGPTAALRRAA